MSERDGSSFETAPVSSGGNRRPTIVAVIVVALVVGGFGLARLSPTPDAGRDEAHVTSPSPPLAPPSPSPATVEPTATALPREEWFSALATPVDDLLVAADSIRWLRSARTEGPALATPGQDLLLVDTRGDTVCLCWKPSRTESGDARALDLVRAWGDGSHLTRVTVMTVDGVDFGAPSPPTQVDLEPSPDGRLAYLARTIRSATAWQVRLDVIDLTSGAILDSADLVPEPAYPTGVASVQAPTLRIAPDGSRALLMSGVRRDLGLGVPTDERHAWVVELDGTGLGRVLPMDRIAEPDQPADSCSWVAFVRPTIVADGCRYPEPGLATTTFEIRRYELTAGGSVGVTQIYLGTTTSEPSQAEADQALIDIGSGVAYAWDPANRILLAADLVTGGWRRVSPPLDAFGDSGQLFPDPRSSPGPDTTWSDGRAATAVPLSRTLAGSPDGRVLFAVGAGDRPDSTSGVWLFDARTGEVVDRWPALASYDAITLFEQGRWLAAIGRPGVTADGGPADWGTSVTIHDVMTGRPILRIGDIGGGTSAPVTFPFAGPLAAPETAPRAATP